MAQILHQCISMAFFAHFFICQVAMPANQHKNQLAWIWKSNYRFLVWAKLSKVIRGYINMESPERQMSQSRTKSSQHYYQRSLSSDSDIHNGPSITVNRSGIHQDPSWLGENCFLNPGMEWRVTLLMWAYWKQAVQKNKMEKDGKGRERWDLWFILGLGQKLYWCDFNGMICQLCYSCSGFSLVWNISMFVHYS